MTFRLNLNQDFSGQRAPSSHAQTVAELRGSVSFRSKPSGRWALGSAAVALLVGIAFTGFALTTALSHKPVAHASVASPSTTGSIGPGR